MTNIELYYELKEFAVVFFYIVIGISARIAYSSQKTRLTQKQIAITIAFGMFGGYTVAVAPLDINKNWRWILISVGSLTGENIVSWIIINSKSIMSKILEILIKKHDDK